MKLGGNPEVLERAVALLQLNDAQKKVVIGQLEEIAKQLAENTAASSRLKVLTDELNNIEKTADGLAQMLGAYGKNLVDIFSITLGAEAIELSRGAATKKVVADPCPAEWVLEYEHRTQLRALAKRAGTIRDAMVEKYGEDRGGAALRVSLLGTPKSMFVGQLVCLWAERFGPDNLRATPSGRLFEFVVLLWEWATGELSESGFADAIKDTFSSMRLHLEQGDPSYWFKQGQLARQKNTGSTLAKKR